MAHVTFANGASAEADVVIAADGIHSELRPYVFPPSRPVFHGSVAYRGLVPHERIPHWPVERWQMWLGTGKHFLAFPVRAGTIINYVGFVPADEEMNESWSAPGDPDVLRREFAGWDPRIAELLQHVQVTFRWALYDREPLPAWTNGRLSLLDRPNKETTSLTGSTGPRAASNRSVLTAASRCWNSHQQTSHSIRCCSTASLSSSDRRPKQYEVSTSPSCG